jgi:hypothetical protein
VTFPCLHCGEPDAHTNAGALFCHDCTDVLTDEGKQAAIDAYLGPEIEEALAA